MIMEIKNKKGLNFNFENLSNPNFSSNADTFLLINDKGLTVEVPKTVWDDHMRKPKVGYQYLGPKGVEAAPVPAEVISKQLDDKEANQEYGQLGGDKPVRTIHKKVR